MSGGLSIGCPGNAGAAGTYFNADLLSLRVGNDNITTETETPLLDFPTSPLWSHVFVENNAKVLVPLLWTRVQVGKFSLLKQLIIFNELISILLQRIFLPWLDKYILQKMWLHNI